MSACPLINPGYWCECTANGKRIGSFDAYSPHQALRWTRISLMMLTTELDEAPYRQAQHWATNGQAQAVRNLRAGHAETFTITHRGTALTWTTRPALFLTMLHRQTTQLPPCSQHFTAREPAGHPPDTRAE